MTYTGSTRAATGSTIAAQMRSLRLTLAQYRFGDPEAVHPDRDTTVDGNLREHGADLVGRKSVAKGRPPQRPVPARPSGWVERIRATPQAAASRTRAHPP